MEKMRHICLLIVPLYLILLTSCAKALYIGRLAWGESKILTGGVPVQDVLRDEGVAEEVKERLKLVQDTKYFAHEKMGLSLDGCYSSFYRVKGDALLYLVSACPKDRLEPFTWSFPIVGKVSYKGFFKKGHALKEQERLERMGLDTCVQRVMAFSTLGWLNDPIFSTMVEQHPVTLINIVIHELVHNTIFFKGETEFNEQVASLIGEKGSLFFIQERFGRDSPYYQLALDLARDEKFVAEFIQEFFDELAGLYRQDLPWEEMMHRRDALFTHGQERFEELAMQLKTEYFIDLGKGLLNNASIISYKNYLITPHNLILQVYKALGCDLRSFIGLLKDIKKTRESPYRSLERWFRERGTPPSG